MKMENKLRAKIETDYIEAYKNREELKISVLRLIKSALKNEEINKKAELSEEDVVKSLRREAKQRKDTILEYKKADQSEAAAKEEAELKIIESYLPSQLSEEDTKKIVEDTINELGITDKSQIGKLIGAVMSKGGGTVDGGMVAKIANQILSDKN